MDAAGRAGDLSGGQQLRKAPSHLNPAGGLLPNRPRYLQRRFIVFTVPSRCGQSITALVPPGSESGNP